MSVRKKSVKQESRPARKGYGRRLSEMRERGVTWVEGLLVVSILTVVAVMVVPVFLSARDRDRQATCISNLGQIGVAFMEYAQDNDQTLFNPFYFEFYKGDRDAGYTSDSTLEPYIKDHAAHDVNCVWVCPNVQKFAMTKPRSKVGYGAFYCTYTMNVFLNAPQTAGRRRASKPVPEPDVCYSDLADQGSPSRRWNRGGIREDLMIEAQPRYLALRRTLPGRRPRTVSVYRPTKLGVRLSQIVSPKGTDLLFEGIVEDYSREDIDTGYVGRAPRQGDYTVDQGFWPTEISAWYKWGYPAQPATLPRHRRLNNYLFCDGHVKAMEPKRYPYDIEHDPDNIWFARIGRNGTPIPPPGGPGC